MALPKAVLLLFSLLFSVNSYEIHTLDFCSDNTIYLGSNDKSALNFSLVNNNHWPRFSDYKCSFKVEASKNQKIIAVIQRMSLRALGSSCLDYIEFTDPPKLLLVDIYRTRNNKKQFCGNKNVSFMSLPNDMVLPAFNLYTLPQNVYFINGNELKVKVFISQTPLRPGETLDFQIIFTAATTGVECRNKMDFDCGNKTCIWQGFYKDGFVNCPYVKCPDEDGCEGPTIKYSSGSGTTIIVCAVVSMLSVLGMFLVCLFICRRCKVLCWASRTPTTRDPSSRVHVSTSHSNETVQPSAPPLISLHDKDLPPSYDSLFPARKTEEGVSLVMEDFIERSSYPLHEPQLVRSEGETVRYHRQKNNTSQTSDLNQAELAASSEQVNRNRTHRPYYNHRRSRHNVGMHSSSRPARGPNQNFTGDRQRGSHTRNGREVQNPSSHHAQGSRIPVRGSRTRTTYTRVRTQSETCASTHHRGRVHPSRNEL